MLRYLRRLADRDVALDRSMIPLGSCTMKLNATTEMEPITWPEFGGIHPFAPISQVAGYMELIGDLELYLTRSAKVDDVQTYHRLQTIPGVGKILALVLLYEIHDIRRFPEVGDFLSYARLVRCVHESAGKVQGTGGHKIGNAQGRAANGNFTSTASTTHLCPQRKAVNECVERTASR